MAEEQPKLETTVKADTDTDATPEADESLADVPAKEPAEAEEQAPADDKPKEDETVEEASKPAPRKSSMFSKLKSIGSIGRTKSKGVPTEPPAPTEKPATTSAPDEEPAAAAPAPVETEESDKIEGTEEKEEAGEAAAVAAVEPAKAEEDYVDVKKEEAVEKKEEEEKEAEEVVAEASKTGEDVPMEPKEEEPEAAPVEEEEVKEETPKKSGILGGLFGSSKKKKEEVKEEEAKEEVKEEEEAKEEVTEEETQITKEEAAETEPAAEEKDEPKQEAKEAPKKKSGLFGLFGKKNETKAQEKEAAATAVQDTAQGDETSAAAEAEKEEEGAKVEQATTVEEETHRNSTALESDPEPVKGTTSPLLKADEFFPANMKVSVSVAMLDASVSQGGHPLYVVAVEVEGKAHDNLGSVAGLRFAAFRALKNELGRGASEGFPRTFIKNMFGIHLTPEQVSDRAECLDKWLNAQLKADATVESFTTLATFLKLVVADNKASVPAPAAVKEEQPVEEEEEENKQAATPSPTKTVPAASEPAAEPVSPTAQ